MKYTSTAVTNTLDVVEFYFFFRTPRFLNEFASITSVLVWQCPEYGRV
jgi:hypothetical protein